MTRDQVTKINQSTKPTEDFFDNFGIHGLIGQGAICEGVYSCVHKKTGDALAVKILDRKKLKFADRTKY